MEATDNRNFHTLRYEEILAVHELNFMVTGTDCGLPNIHCIYTSVIKNKKKGTLTRSMISILSFLPCACFFIFPCSLPFVFYAKWCFLSSIDLKVMSIFVLQVISSIKKYIWGKKRLNASLWDARADTPWMIRLPSQVPRPYWLAMYMLVFLFLKPWMNVSLLF